MLSDKQENSLAEMCPLTPVESTPAYQCGQKTPPREVTAPGVVGRRVLADGLLETPTDHWFN